MCLEPLEVRHAADLASAATRKLFDDHFTPAELTEEGFRAQTPGLSAMPGWCAFAIEFVSIELISKCAVLNAPRVVRMEKTRGRVVAYPLRQSRHTEYGDDCRHNDDRPTVADDESSSC